MFVTELDGRLANPILLSIDMQQAFSGDAWPRSWNGDVDKNGLALLDAFRRQGHTIIHVRHDSVEDGSSLRPGQEGHNFRAGFGPKGDEALVTKSVNSSFVGTDLDLRLKRLQPSVVIAFGIATDMCVSTTVRHGANLGWSFVVAGDACDCFDLPDGAGGTIVAEDIQRAHLATLSTEFCDVARSADIVAALGSFRA